MSLFPEIPSNTIKIIDRDDDGNKIPEQKYYVRTFGMNGMVIEKELVPIPDKKVIKILNPDGTIKSQKEE